MKFHHKKRTVIFRPAFSKQRCCELLFVLSFYICRSSYHYSWQKRWDFKETWSPMTEGRLYVISLEISVNLPYKVLSKMILRKAILKFNFTYNNIPRIIKLFSKQLLFFMENKCKPSQHMVRLSVLAWLMFCPIYATSAPDSIILVSIQNKS